MQEKMLQYSSIGARFKEIRKELDLSQEIFAELLGISRHSVMRYEKGEKFINKEALIQLSQMGYNINWLLTGKGEMKIDQESGAELSQLKKEIKELAEEDARLGRAAKELAEKYHKDGSEMLAIMLKFVQVLIDSTH